MTLLYGIIWGTKTDRPALLETAGAVSNQRSLVTMPDHTSDLPQTQPLKRCPKCGCEYRMLRRELGINIKTVVILTPRSTVSVTRLPEQNIFDLKPFIPLVIEREQFILQLYGTRSGARIPCAYDKRDNVLYVQRLRTYWNGDRF